MMYSDMLQNTPIYQKTMRVPAYRFYLISLLFWCLLAIFIFDQTDTDLRTAQPVTMDAIQD